MGNGHGVRALITLFTAAFFGGAEARATPTIQEQIDMAKPNSVVRIREGTYLENQIRVTKPIVLDGEGKVLIDGGGKEEIFLLQGEGITIRGFTLLHSGRDYLHDLAAIRVNESKNVVIEKNNIRNTFFAIYVGNSKGTVIRDNRIQGAGATESFSGDGIHVWHGVETRIENNVISGHRDGIYLEFSSQGEILGNQSYQQFRYGLHFMFSDGNHFYHNVFKSNGAGVAVMYSKNIVMDHNEFSDQQGSSSYGLLLKDISTSKITHNQFARNSIAIHIEGGADSLFEENVFRQNAWAIKLFGSSENNRFIGNEFIQNKFDVSSSSLNLQNEFTKNYWDRYHGLDLNRDGWGDIPYRPITLSSVLIEQNPLCILFLRSVLITMVERFEAIFPDLVSSSVLDHFPAMKRAVHD